MGNQRVCIRAKPRSIPQGVPDPWPWQRGIARLIVCGIRTGQCGETTARHASDDGWTVDFVAEATLTFPMQMPAGRTLRGARGARLNRRGRAPGSCV
ncbi:MAG: isochorismatase family protein [Burkholderiales bacterium]|nr:MAG: isochorismatase family protein [Burkholderiales bacterium]